MKAVPGFSNEVDHLKRAATVSTSKKLEKLVTLFLDEMYIEENLIYEKHDGIIVGFVNLGSVNDHLLAFEHFFNAGTDDESRFGKECYDLYGERALSFAVEPIHVCPLPVLLCNGRPTLPAILGSDVSFRTDRTPGISLSLHVQYTHHCCLCFPCYM